MAVRDSLQNRNKPHSAQDVSGRFSKVNFTDPDDHMIWCAIAQLLQALLGFGVEGLTKREVCWGVASTSWVPLLVPPRSTVPCQNASYQKQLQFFADPPRKAEKSKEFSSNHARGLYTIKGIFLTGKAM